MVSLLALHLIGVLFGPAGRVASAAQIPPSIENPASPDEWIAVGPFLMGTREGYIDHLIEHGGEDGIRPEIGMAHSSPMGPGGLVRWADAQVDGDGVSLDLKAIDWDALRAHHGGAGAASACYAYSECRSDIERRGLLTAERVSQLWLNGRVIFGDIYGADFLRQPVVLSAGTNRILVKLRGSKSFSLTFLPVPSPVVINTLDATAPDLLTEQSLLPSEAPDGWLEQWLAVPLVNTTPGTLADLSVVVSVASGASTGAIRGSETALASLPPFGILKVPVAISVATGALAASTADSVVLRIEVSTGAAAGETGRISGNAREGSQGRYATSTAPGEPVAADQPPRATGTRPRVLGEGSLVLRVRKPGGVFRVTFRSRIDESVQQYSVLPPSAFDPGHHYSLILSLHGASGQSDGQAGAYSQKDWAFVVAPTNRRPFGFDWQDWGRLDAIEVLDQVLGRFPIDNDRVYLTGHSMGGHGVWHIGLHYPDRFAALAPSAGWTSFQLYAPFFLTRGYLYAPPRLNAIRETVLREDVPPLMTENALNLPAFVLEGEKDDDVWPFHPRLMVGLLRSLGYGVTYREVPGKGHWWDDEEGLPGVACLDLPEMMDFLKSRVRDPNPRHVIYRTANTSVNNRVYWVEIGEVERPYEDSRIEAEVVGERKVAVKTTNVQRLVLDLREGVVPPGRTDVDIDGVHSVVSAPGRHAFAKDKGRFKHMSSGGMDGARRASHGLLKRPDLSGPIRQAFFTPFLFVYGTAGDEDDTALSLRLAVDSANYWWWRANGLARVVADTALTEDERASYNLVLLGSATTNRITRLVARERLPIEVRPGAVRVGAKEFAGNDLAVRMVYPSPFCDERLVQIDAGTGTAGMALTPLLGTFYSAAGLPDYVVYGPDVKTKGWGGVVAAGFFDKRWRLYDEGDANGYLRN